MTERKTCGTCGPGGGLCEWRDNTCPFSEWEKISGTRECVYHASFREQLDRVEKAEARIAELEDSYAQITTIAIDMRAELHRRGMVKEEAPGWDDAIRVAMDETGEEPCYD